MEKHNDDDDQRRREQPLRYSEGLGPWRARAWLQTDSQRDERAEFTCLDKDVHIHVSWSPSHDTCRVAVTLMAD
jgi:hypothetical protein